MSIHGATGGLLMRSYRLPLERSWAVLVIFWPTLLLQMIGGWIGSLGDDFKSVFLGLLIAVMQWILFAIGAVTWHRHIVLGEPPKTARWFSSEREKAYVRQAILVGTLFCSLIILPTTFWHMGSTSTVEQLTSSKSAVIKAHFVLTVFSVGGCLAFALIGTRLSFRLPAIALEEGSKAVESKASASTARLVVLASTAPIFIAMMLTILLLQVGGINVTTPTTTTPEMMASGQLYFAWSVLGSFATVYGSIVFLSALSQLWLQRHRAVVRLDKDMSDICPG